MRTFRLAMIVLVLAGCSRQPGALSNMDAHTILTPDGAANLQRLVDSVRRGELGEEAKDAEVDTSPVGYARIYIARPGKDRAAFTLFPPFRGDEIAERRHFELVPDDGIAPNHTEHLTAVLEKLLVADPWQHATRPRPAFWMLPGGDFAAVSPGRMLFAALFLFVTIAGGVGFILFARPRSDEERLVAK